MCISAKKEALKDEPGLRRVHAFSSFIQLLACVLAQLSPPPYNALVVAGHPLSPEHMHRAPPRTPAPQTRWPRALTTSGSRPRRPRPGVSRGRWEEHTSELQSPCNLVCRLLLQKTTNHYRSTPSSAAAAAP